MGWKKRVVVVPSRGDDDSSSSLMVSNMVEESIGRDGIQYDVHIR